MVALMPYSQVFDNIGYFYAAKLKKNRIKRQFYPIYFCDFLDKMVKKFSPILSLINMIL